MGNSSYFRLGYDNKTSIYIYIYIISIITKEMGKLKAHSPTYCIMDNWENMLNLSHELHKLYLTGILYVQCLQIKFAQWWYWDGVMYKQTNTICKPKHIRLFALIINCTILMKTNSRLSRNVYTISDRIWCNKHLRHTTTKNIKTMAKVDTSDLMMIITWVVNISFQSPVFKWDSWTHTTP